MISSLHPSIIKVRKSAHFDFASHFTLSEAEFIHSQHLTQKLKFFTPDFLVVGTDLLFGTWTDLQISSSGSEPICIKFCRLIEKCCGEVKLKILFESAHWFKSYELPNPKILDFCPIFESEYLRREWRYWKSALYNIVQLIEIYLPAKFQVEIRKKVRKQTAL